ncbi:MAG: polysaccharide deacetylase family protein, partial [Gammaproteobacteria bacterium]|nr:polysaccharide deacetylase family protein [Gammaproteobacteria bacterium]
MVIGSAKELLLGYILSLYPKKTGIVVLTLHNVEPRYYEWFDRLLKLIVDKYHYVQPVDFLKKSYPANESSIQVMLSFDDGYYSNRLIAEKYMLPRSMTGLFFITEGFVGLDSNESCQFVKRNFFPKSNPNISNEDIFKAMSWEDVEWLYQNGHVIGAHTKTHLNLAGESNDTALHQEIVLSANRLSSRLQSPIQTFAYPFGNLQTLDAASFKLADSRFDYVFSNIRGNVNESPGDKFIFRQNIVPGTSMR